MGASQLVLDVAGERTRGRGGQDIVDTSLQSAPLGGDSGCGKGSEPVGQCEGFLQPKPETRRQDILARLLGIGDVPGQMGKRAAVNPKGPIDTAGADSLPE